ATSHAGNVSGSWIWGSGASASIARGGQATVEPIGALHGPSNAATRPNVSGYGLNQHVDDVRVAVAALRGRDLRLAVVVDIYHNAWRAARTGRGGPAAGRRHLARAVAHHQELLRADVQELRVAALVHAVHLASFHGAAAGASGHLQPKSSAAHPGQAVLAGAARRAGGEDRAQHAAERLPQPVGDAAGG